MSAGFGTELFRGSLLIWIRGFDDLRVATDGVSVQEKSSSSVGKAGSPVCLAWF